MSAFLNFLDNIFSTSVAFYFYFISKCLDASEHLQEQFQLYSIAAKFIYDQAAPKINTLTTALICVQITSILIISFVIFARIKSSLHHNKKIKLRSGETIEVVRTKTKRNPNIRIHELRSLALQAISADSGVKSSSRLQLY